MTSKKALFVAAAFATLAAPAAAITTTACGDVPQPVVCRDIPDGGCPYNAQACEDPTCAAVYHCEADGTWLLDHVCPARDGATEAGGDGGDGGTNDGSPGARDAAFADVPGASGGPGCVDLEPPDCPLATGAACPANQCCGCEDLYVCVDGGWNPWGSCDPTTGVISSK